jgi:hypothetical protein
MPRANGSTCRMEFRKVRRSAASLSTPWWLGARINDEELHTIEELGTVKPPMERGFSNHLRNAIRWPELALAGFAFLLNFPWEIIQSPLFEGMASMPHSDAVPYCTRAALGDAGIMVIAFWTVATVSGRGRSWLQQSGPMPIASFTIIGLLITVFIELLATSGRWFWGWTYSSDMPILWGVNVGLVPILQWIILPPVAVLLARRQLR